MQELPGLPATAETLTPRLMGKALEGLAEIHAAGILHYDIAARNILVSHDGESVWWIDFDDSRNSVEWDISEPDFQEEMARAQMQLTEREFYLGLG